VGLDVWAEGDPDAARECGHSLDVGVYDVEIDEQ
jgi:hypothetical protein